MKWPTTRLGDVCNVIPGFAFKSADFSSVGIPVVKIKNITGDLTVNLQDVDYLPEKLMSSRLNRYVLRNGDVLVAMTGATAGKIGKVRAECPLLLNQRVAKIEAVRAESGFIWAVLSSREYQEKMYNLAYGSAQPNMSGRQIEDMEIPLPSLVVQRCISDIICSLDDKIELNRRMNETLEQMAMALYKHWFVDFGPFQDGEFVESELGLIPKGWEVSTVGRVSENFDSRRVPMSSRERAKRHGEFPYYGAADVVDYVDDYLFDGVYLLVGEDGSVTKPNGKPYLQYVEGKIWVNNHAHVLQGRGLVSTEWLRVYFETLDISRYVTGAVQPKLTKGNLNSLKFLLPTEDHGLAFKESIAPLFDLVRSNVRENALLIQTRDYLLPRLLSGEIDLPEAEEKVKEVM
ncbi:restriction endonuclease subunit S [Alicyclobacillus cycloheptanicus]|uniref:Type I restriction enzyme S subunit n=1 Tax=Alicyclobacillus cycloheptanicus TaxID=1457 RepID=A0ABT9XLV4_9BACL|nr:restriction endonuclease subunit S [Alicyclobacillus cycloheptanicus]MDQ0191265.1 type I restriction enzyme S subunit [Alicyclobacillus cycloheptanicus]WDM00458.1 restriction endonuclease subunit S [Alicyclobacillus cycloheptanicus]